MFLEVAGSKLQETCIVLLDTRAECRGHDGLMVEEMASLSGRMLTAL